jgi:hypothetical protein
LHRQLLYTCHYVYEYPSPSSIFFCADNIVAELLEEIDGEEILHYTKILFTQCLDGS